MRTLRLDLRYDGTDFFGWQVQPDRRTVQGELERALAVVLDGPVRVVAAGRTDRGVHALRQVSSFATDRAIPVEGLRRGLNALLPADMQVDRVREEAEGFHARFSATGRSYRYHLSDRPGPIRRRYAWCLRRLPEAALLESATAPLLGRHDFTAFSGADDEGSNPLCAIRTLAWRRREHRLVFSIEADRFLNRMVRTIVGNVIALERSGELSPGRMAELLAAGDRTRAARVAPPAGLFLVGVTYPGA